MPGCCRVFPGGSGLLAQPRRNALQGVVIAQGVVDPAVPELFLVVDASGVDAQEDGDAVSGAAGDLGGGHARVELEPYKQGRVTGSCCQRRQ
jgi:hypothetical protein